MPTVQVGARRVEYVDDNPDGHTPVVLFHGSPGSRLFRPRRVPPSIRLITYDRPGYGRSTSQPGRSVTDSSVDVAAILDALGIETAAVVGWSGGCPFAVATAWALGPRRVRALALVSGPAPIDEVPGAWELLGDKRRPAAEVARNGEPDRAARAIAREMEPFLSAPTAFLGRGRGPDAQVFAQVDDRSMLEAQIIEALAPGADGIAQDLIAMWMPFGFELRDVMVPTHVFHGAHDRHNDADTATYARNIPGAQRTVWDDAGHLGVFMHTEAVFAAVVGGRP